jgi:hypothetical protein
MMVISSAGRATILCGALAALLLPTACRRPASPHGVVAEQPAALSPVPVAPPPVSGKLEFVGCAGNGQQGPTPAPAPPRVLPEYPPEIAARLAYYTSDNLAVVAPRGWHCVGRLGSSGAGLLITPEVQAGSGPSDLDKKTSGPAIFASRSFGTETGRFEVARIAARVFPIAKKFVQTVIAKSPESRGTIRFAPYPNDTITRLSDTDIEFETPANSDGLGTDRRLEKNGQPIIGAAMLNGDMDLFMIAVRLPPEDKDLVVTTMQAFEGSPVPRR